MKRTSSERFSRKIGRIFGRTKHEWLRQENRFTIWAMMKGVPKIMAQALLWTVKLAVLAVALYVAFWIVLVVSFFVVAVLGLSSFDWNEEENESRPQWKNGYSGFGLYRGDVRIDFGDTDSE